MDFGFRVPELILSPLGLDLFVTPQILARLADFPNLLEYLKLLFLKAVRRECIRAAVVHVQKLRFPDKVDFIHQNSLHELRRDRFLESVEIS